MLLSCVLHLKALLPRCKLLPVFPGGRSYSLPKFLGQLETLGYSSPNINRVMPHWIFFYFILFFFFFFFCFQLIPLTVYVWSTELYRSRFMCYILLLAMGVLCPACRALVCKCLCVVRMAPGWGRHHIDTLLVISSVTSLSFLILFLPCPSLSSLLSLFSPFSGRQHKMTQTGWHVIKPQHN